MWYSSCDKEEWSRHRKYFASFSSVSGKAYYGVILDSMSEVEMERE